MDLRKRTSQTLALTGAVLIVAGLSLSGGVALAADDDDDQGSSSKREKSSKSERKSKSKSTSTTETTDSSDSPRSTGSTGSTATTGTTGTTRPYAPATTAPPTTATTRATPTTVAPTTTTTAAPAETQPQQVDPSTDPSDPADDARTTGREHDAPTSPDSPTSPDAPEKRPASRSGSGLPPGVYPIGPGARSANSNPPVSIAPAPVAAVPGSPAPVAPTETAPPREGSGTATEAGVSDPVTDSLLEPAVEANRAESPAPAPARRSQQLSQTGDGTRRLILFGGLALLLGAVVVAITGRDRPVPLLAVAPAGPAARHYRPRRELDGWEDGVPLAPAKRELARLRLGISADRAPLDDEPGA